ncbi:MAG TPA: NAD-dependent epimerase/dehydratase family protein [Gemmatimonadaceae bacterium]|nr:NAD-dependent epimerase/dehydratase family protein [Gemmatimonadaceae bacterium]
MRVFVTGAASPLGRALVSALKRRGDYVIGLVRRRGGLQLLKNIGAEAVLGDVRRSESLARQMAGCDAVFHVASFFDFWARDARTFDSVNVGGTKNTIAAAVVAKVPRLIHVSSALAIGEPKGETGYEWTRHRGETRSEFERSKLEAERIAMRLRGKGIEIVVVEPSLVLAPSDMGWIGRVMRRAVGGGPRFATDAPMSWVVAEDAAQGMIAALDRGKNGERYILSGERMSMRQLMDRVAQLTGRRPARKWTSRQLDTVAKLSEMIASTFGKRPLLPPEEARFLMEGVRVDGAWARGELGLKYTPIASVLPTMVQSYQRALERFAS